MKHRDDGAPPLTWSTVVTNRETRQIARCKCGAIRSRLVGRRITRTFRSDMIAEVDRRVVETGNVAVNCACGKPLWFKDVKGTLRADIVCTAKCTSSKGPTCECSCGGKNHGAAYG